MNLQIRYRTELPGLMKRLGLPMVGAELGTAEGNFSEELLKAGLDLFLVDNYATIKNQKGDGGSPQEWHDSNFKKATARVLPFGFRAIFLKGLSVEMADRVPDDSLGLVYLDGDHSYNGVYDDLKAWFPKLVRGGIMAGHDFLMPEYGVKKAVEHFTIRYDTYVSKIYLLLENKTEDAGFYFQKL